MFQIPSSQMYQRAIDAFNRNQWALAESSCRAVLKVEPKRADALLLLARIVMEASRLEEVDPLLAQARQCGAAEADLLIVQSSLRWREGRDEDVVALGLRVLSLRPRDLDAILRIASAERRLKRPHAAIDRLKPHLTNPVAATLAAWSYIDLKEPARAVEVLTPVLQQQLTAMVKSNALHALGVAREALGQYDEAMVAYTGSNEAIPISVDEGAMRRDINNIRQYFTRARIAAAPKPTVRTARPVFIAAMPRSGTTLLDRIIAAHPQCAGAGETRALRTQVTEWAGPTADKAWPTIVGSFGSADFDRIASRYIAGTDQFGASALRMADKHLMNWTMVGLISMAFPEARVIHLRRDPDDTGISCFERLRPGQIAWSRSLRLIGVALKACDTLMAHWHEVATVPILSVQYETLVRNPESETRRIIDFLGLPWEDACLSHHDRGHQERSSPSKKDGTLPPPTLSSEQAAKPIYDSSIGRGARFGAALDPLRQAYAEPF